jgi:hypothetical protein
VKTLKTGLFSRLKLFLGVLFFVLLVKKQGLLGVSRFDYVQAIKFAFAAE